LHDAVVACAALDPVSASPAATAVIVSTVTHFLIAISFVWLDA
jgi:hypothetical protein